MDIFIIATKYMFWVGFVGMAAGTLYFLVERGGLDPKYRSTATLAALVCFVAAVHYQAMKDYVGTDASIDTLLTFPTEIRYIDWLITTPLLLIKFPALLGLVGNAARSLMTRLIVADLVMIVTGYIGETSINQAGGSTFLGWIMFIVAMLAWGYILRELYTGVTRSAQSQPESIRKGLLRMRQFILIGWAIYPLGYFATLLGSGVGELMVVREFIYNVADLVNKVGFGLVAVLAVKHFTAESTARDTRNAAQDGATA